MAKQTFVTGQVLTAAQQNALQANDYNQTVSAKVASYVLVAADAGTRITMSNAGATTITVNTSLFTAGDTNFITNIGAGACTITAGTATVSTASSLVLAQYDSGRLYFTSTGVAIWEKYAGTSGTSGSMTLLTTTALSGASTIINSIDQTYKKLRILIYGMTNATADGIFTINVPTGTFVGAGGYGTTAAAGNPINAVFGDLVLQSNALRTDNTNSFLLEIDNYSNATTHYAPFHYAGFYTVTSGQGQALNEAGIVSKNVTSLVFSNTGGNQSTGTVLIYGVN